MKLRISHCPKCERDTLQARTEISRGYTFKGPNHISVWFCSLCGSYLHKVKKEYEKVVEPTWHIVGHESSEIQP